VTPNREISRTRISAATTLAAEVMAETARVAPETTGTIHSPSAAGDGMAEEGLGEEEDPEPMTTEIRMIKKTIPHAP